MRRAKHRGMKKTSYDGRVKGVVSRTVNKRLLGLLARRQENNARILSFYCTPSSSASILDLFHLVIRVDSARLSLFWSSLLYGVREPPFS